MSKPRKPQLAKLVIGFFLKDKSLIFPLADDFNKKFGQADIISSWFPFDYTNYYKKEMGVPLFRRLFSFKTLIKQNNLARIKTITNTIELRYARTDKRMVNIDPGYLLDSRFVLATGKNYNHRIYIGSCIYADLTLIYSKGKFRTLPWTYPDYAADNMLTFLNQVRKKYIEDCKQYNANKNDNVEVEND